MVEELYESAIAYWSLNFLDEQSGNEPSGTLSYISFCTIDGINVLNGGAVLRQSDYGRPWLSPKITLSTYPTDCPTDPEACDEGFTVAFWLSLKDVNGTLENNSCMVLSLNDTSRMGFQIRFGGDGGNVSFWLLGTVIESSEVYDATDEWIWNHLGMTWNNRTQELKVFSNGQESNNITVGVDMKDPPLVDGIEGCSYLALDEVAIWDWPLNETEMMALRLDPFNLTNDQPTTTAGTTDSKFSLSAGKSGIGASVNIAELINNLTNIHSFLLEHGDNPKEINKTVLGEILFLVGDVIPDLVKDVSSEERASVLEKYMEIVNSVLEINRKIHDENLDNEDKFLLAGADLGQVVDHTVSAYLLTGNDSEISQFVSNPYIDTRLVAFDAPSQKEISMEFQKNESGVKNISVVIPQSIFDGSGFTGRVAVTLYYKGIQEHLPKNVMKTGELHDVFSSLVGININTNSKSDFKDKVSIVASHPEVDVKNETKCAFLKLDKDNNPIWSTDGCTKSDASKETSTKCECNHLTNFAVLVSTKKIDYNLALDILSNLGLALSIVCLILTLIILNILRQLNSIRISILKHTAAALLLAQSMFILGGFVANLETFCKVVAALTHYFFLTVFCWLLIQGVHLYMKVRRALKGNIDMIYFCIFGWCFPLVVVGISFGLEHEQYGVNKICWISVQEGVGALVAFLGPAYFVLGINLVVLCMVMHVFMTVKVNKDKSEKDKIKSGMKAIIVMIPILGLAWLFGLLNIIDSGVLAFQYLFIIFNCLQGVFIFVFHVVLNDEVKQAFVQKRNKIAASKNSDTLFSKVMKSRSGTEHSTSDASTTQTSRKD